ncbi:MAG: type II toxin-antitoxin system HicB family antitoxin [Nitrospinae bacterium]|nr:type II toxin-antitoxin system HicB family antitoxin [Nitrospinota bacterium]
MKDTIEHDGFIGSVHFSAEDKCFFGKIEGIEDLVSFEGDTVEKLTEDFRLAVEDYRKLCKKAGKDPFKSCKGAFNVRIPRKLHILAVKKASREGISLNHLVQRAIEHETESVDP